MMKDLWIGCLLTAAACGASASTPADGGVPDDAAGPVADAAPFTTGVSTIAGVAEAGDRDGDRNLARFANPVNVLAAAGGVLYVADFDNGLVRRVDSGGVVTTLIRQAGFTRPFGLARAPDGTIYVETDNDAHGAHSSQTGTVWRLDLTARTARVVATNLGRPRGLAVLADGRVAMADAVHDVVSVLDPATGRVVLVAGAVDVAGYVDATGGAARFSRPYGVAVRGDGKLVITDQGNHRLRLVDPVTGVTTTLAGNGTPAFADGPRATAAFNLPQGIAITPSGDLYVTDTGNYRVRRIHDDVVETFAGNGRGGYLDAADRQAASFYGLEGISVAPDGLRVFVADGSRGEPLPYNRVRVVEVAP
jgi:sugar lactone lactonase YvrE